MSVDERRGESSARNVVRRGDDLSVKIKVKVDNESRWGFVESYRVWRNYLNRGYIEVLVGISPAGEFTRNYIWRGGEFVSVSEATKDVSLERYLKAKKPFYSLLSEGFIAKIRVGYDFNEGKILEKSSDYEIYKIGDDSTFSKMDGELPMMRVREVNPIIVSLINRKLSKEIAECGTDRYKFIAKRNGLG